MRATPYQSSRTLVVLSKMFNLAELWGLRPDGSNPCLHVKRYREETTRAVPDPRRIRTARLCPRRDRARGFRISLGCGRNAATDVDWMPPFGVSDSSLGACRSRRWRTAPARQQVGCSNRPSRSVGRSRPHRLASRSRESVGHRRQEARITSDGSQSPVVADSGACRYRSPDRTAFVTPGGMQVRPDATINLHAPARVDPSSGNLLEIQPNPARRPREIRLVLDPYPSAGCSSVRGITVTQTNSPARAAARHASRGRFA